MEQWTWWVRGHNRYLHSKIVCLCVCFCVLVRVVLTVDILRASFVVRVYFACVPLGTLGAGVTLVGLSWGLEGSIRFGSIRLDAERKE